MTDETPKPKGDPLPFTDAELELLAEVTPDDIERARALWRRTVPPEFRDLLDAEVIDE